MKVIWQSHGKITMQDLIDNLRDNYGKNYARTTVATFVGKLKDKGYADSCRQGKNSYVISVISEEQYRVQLLEDNIDFWYGGDAEAMIETIFNTGRITKQDVVRIAEILDEF